MYPRNVKLGINKRARCTGRLINPVGCEEKHLTVFVLGCLYESHSHLSGIGQRARDIVNTPSYLFKVSYAPMFNLQ